MTAITVYTKPGCPQCRATLRALDHAGLDYTVVDLADDPDTRHYLLALGHLAAPVVAVGGEHWSGYRPDRIHALAAATA
jgi:glutaredoxin-like protein NrdH